MFELILFKIAIRGGNANMFKRFLRSLGPIILGTAVGLAVALNINAFGIKIDSLVRILAAIAVSLLLLAIISWLFYSYVKDKKLSNLKSEMRNNLEAFKKQGKSLKDPDSLIVLGSDIWKHVGPVIGGYLSFIFTMGVSLALLTNTVLIAQTAVGYLQAERLSAQNQILREDLKITRINGKNLLYTDLARINEIIFGVNKMFPDSQRSGPTILKTKNGKDVYSSRFILEPCEFNRSANLLDEAMELSEPEFGRPYENLKPCETIPASDFYQWLVSPNYLDLTEGDTSNIDLYELILESISNKYEHFLVPENNEIILNNNKRNIVESYFEFYASASAACQVDRETIFNLIARYRIYKDFMSLGYEFHNAGGQTQDREKGRLFYKILHAPTVGRDEATLQGAINQYNSWVDQLSNSTYVLNSQCLVEADRIASEIESLRDRSSEDTNSNEEKDPVRLTFP